MGLFSALTSSASEPERQSTSPLAIPTAIQLYSKKPVLLGKNVKIRNFDILSYQAIAVPSSASEEEPQGGALLSKQQKEATNQHPNLGIWNCRVSKAKVGVDQEPLVDAILRTIPSFSPNPPTVCLTIDISNVPEVEPTISLLQDALVRYLIASDLDKANLVPCPTATTSLFDLRSTNFGLADNDEESAKRLSASPPDEADKNICLALVICVVLSANDQTAENAPQEASSGGYKEKQAEALLVYHLRKYAARLNAFLCFVREEKSTDEDPKSISPLTPGQFFFVLRQLSQGEEDWKQLNSMATTAMDEGNDEQSAVSAIYGPGNQHEEMIDAVLLRNAQFPGHWDASKDSIWYAIPATQNETFNEKAVDDAGKAGDEPWLSELRSSVASEAKTPPPKEKGAKPEASQTPNDAAVSSFFEGLLKS